MACTPFTTCPTATARRPSESLSACSTATGHSHLTAAEPLRALIWRSGLALQLGAGHPSRSPARICCRNSDDRVADVRLDIRSRPTAPPRATCALWPRSRDCGPRGSGLAGLSTSTTSSSPHSAPNRVPLRPQSDAGVMAGSRPRGSDE